MSCVAAGGLSYELLTINGKQAASQAIADLPAPIATNPGGGTGAASGATQAFDGTTVNTKYGPVQVQVQVENHVISDVAVVQYPSGDSKSIRINAGALPKLRNEVLVAQSAKIDTVSGATYTSTGYTTSLQAAIDAARAANVLSAA